VARRLRRRAKKPTARGQKISSPETPPFFARSPKRVAELIKQQGGLVRIFGS